MPRNVRHSARRWRAPRTSAWQGLERMPLLSVPKNQATMDCAVTITGSAIQRRRSVWVPPRRGVGVDGPTIAEAVARQTGEPGSTTAFRRCALLVSVGLGSIVGPSTIGLHSPKCAPTAEGA
jgi:hypothetical protein